jgi:membrane dipeptidase
MIGGVVFVFIMDAHCDTLLDIAAGRRRLAERDKGGHIDLPRMAEGGVSSQIFAIYVEPEYLPGAGARQALRLVDVFCREIEENCDSIVFAVRAGDVARARDEGKIAAFLSIEGGEALDGCIELLRVFYRLGVRLMTLTWSRRNELGDGAYEEGTRGGLTRFGVDVVREMDRLGIVVDVSHLSEATFWHVMEVSTKPLIASHSNARALCGHSRNLSDEQAKALADRGGVVGVTFVGPFLGDGRQSVQGVVDHIDHFAGVIGTDHIAIGSDFDGVPDGSLPEGLPDVSRMPAIIDELARRGYSDAAIRSIMGENLLRTVEGVIG